MPGFYLDIRSKTQGKKLKLQLKKLKTQELFAQFFLKFKKNFNQI